jgi:hypothetical protein
MDGLIYSGVKELLFTFLMCDFTVLVVCMYYYFRMCVLHIGGRYLT